jgi:cytochrome c oxidase subunit III
MSPAEAAIAHQFNDLDQQHDASTLGMWIFLVTEVMFFGGLFAGYSVYRAMFPSAWAQGSRLCEVTLGAINTAVLICSSLTMAMAVHSAQSGRRKRTVMFLISTMLLGGVFLGVKFLEYFHKYQEHLIPGTGFAYKAADSAQVQLFVCFYFGMTGLHALHMIIGIGVVAVITILAWRGRFTPDYHNPVEVTGLYWHFVDIVWIFLFPLLYLVDLHK